MPFHIVPSTAVSLADLVGMHRAGFYVLKTPHVGNIYPNNLAVASLGIPLLLVDQTIGAKDRNFHPHRVIVGGKAETVADEEKMTSLAKIQRAAERVPGRFVPNESLAEAHVHALRDAFPFASIETTSERTRRYADLLEPFLEAMTAIAPQAWRRIVRPDGTVCVRPSPVSWKAVMAAGIHGMSPDGSGWIIPNAWEIMADGIVGAITTGLNTVYALSGPDMIRYYRQLIPEMTKWYDAVRRELGGDKLPETLTMVMVPVADMRLVTTKARAKALNHLVETSLAFFRAKRLAGERMSGLSRDEQNACLDSIHAERNRGQDALRQAAQDCREIFYRIEDATCLTQYDLLAGEELFVHPWGVETPIGKVIELMNLLRRIVPA